MEEIFYEFCSKYFDRSMDSVVELNLIEKISWVKCIKTLELYCDKVFPYNHETPKSEVKAMQTRNLDFLVKLYNKTLKDQQADIDELVNHIEVDGILKYATMGLSLNYFSSMMHTIFESFKENPDFDGYVYAQKQKVYHYNSNMAKKKEHISKHDLQVMNVVNHRHEKLKQVKPIQNVNEDPTRLTNHYKAISSDNQEHVKLIKQKYLQDKNQVKRTQELYQKEVEKRRQQNYLVNDVNAKEIFKKPVLNSKIISYDKNYVKSDDNNNYYNAYVRASQNMNKSKGYADIYSHNMSNNESVVDSRRSRGTVGYNNNDIPNHYSGNGDNVDRDMEQYQQNSNNSNNNNLNGNYYQGHDQYNTNSNLNDNDNNNGVVDNYPLQQDYNQQQYQNQNQQQYQQQQQYQYPEQQYQQNRQEQEEYKPMRQQSNNVNVNHNNYNYNNNNYADMYNQQNQPMNVQKKDNQYQSSNSKTAESQLQSSNGKYNKYNQYNELVGANGYDMLNSKVNYNDLGLKDVLDDLVDNNYDDNYQNYTNDIDYNINSQSMLKHQNLLDQNRNNYNSNNNNNNNNNSSMKKGLKNHNSIRNMYVNSY